MRYSSNEGTNVTVCAEHQQQAEKGFTLNISTPMSTGRVNKFLTTLTSVLLCASDFSLEGDSQLVFPSGGQSESSCANVTISDDGLFEGEETHCLTLQSSDPDITTGATSVTCIVIADDDSKLRYFGG